MVVLCSCAQPGTKLVCCVQSCWPLRDKRWVHREAPTSSGLKEFSDCCISKTESWKRAASFKAASEISGSPFPLFHLFLSRAGDGVYFSEVRKKEQMELRLRKSKLLTWNLRGVQSFTTKPRQCPELWHGGTWREGPLQGLFTSAFVDMTWPWSL